MKKKILCVLIALSTLFLCVFSFNGCKKEQSQHYKREGDYIYFGNYIQTVKDEGVTVTKESDESVYYIGSDGARYRYVCANIEAGRNYKFSNGETIVDGKNYYFKVEPIRWRILSESGGTATLLCDSIIISKNFDGDSNNWKNSSLRAWLNNQLYNGLFNESERAIIQTSLVDNSVESTGYTENEHVCENTEDKIYLLSYYEVFNKYSLDRRVVTSDYARASGVSITSSTEYFGNGYWWLRSPSDINPDYVRVADCWGGLSNIRKVNSIQGIVPALKIKL